MENLFVANLDFLQVYSRTEQVLPIPRDVEQPRGPCPFPVRRFRALAKPIAWNREFQDGTKAQNRGVCRFR